MRKQLTVSVVVAAALVALSASLRAQAADPWIGTWRVNLAKSTYNPGPTPKTAGTVRVEPAPGGAIKTTIDAENPQGQMTHTESVAAFDGRDNPVLGAPAGTTNALKRIDARTFEVQAKVAGKPTVTTRVAVSPDGKVITATQTGQNAQGQAVKNVIVLEKQ